MRVQARFFISYLHKVKLPYFVAPVLRRPDHQARSDLVVAYAVGRHQDHLGPHDLEVRQRKFGRAPTLLGGLVSRKIDPD